MNIATERTMRKLAVALVTIATAMPAIAVSNARAENGQVATGIAGGLLGGLLLGGALAPQPRYYGPGPVYVEPQRYRCYFTRGEPYWDDYRGVWRHPRVRVCD
jgi:hypothetical protein